MYHDGVKNAQRVLRALADYRGAIDGDPGALSLGAAAPVLGVLRITAIIWTPARRVVAAAQKLLAGLGYDVGAIDGLWGPQTDAAFAEWRASGAGPALPDRAGEWGTQADVEKLFGRPGGPACTAGRITPPWKMTLAWDAKEVITSFACHELVAASGQRAFDKIAAAYDPDEIRALGLHLYGGCYNLRLKRGGSTYSMHSWGVAIDFDPAHNRLQWGRDRARLALPDAAAFWAAWESEGWASLGRARNYDWMHVQAPAI